MKTLFYRKHLQVHHLISDLLSLLFQIIHLPLIYPEFSRNFRSIAVVGVISGKHLCYEWIFPAHGRDKFFVNHLAFSLVHRRKVIVIIHKIFRYFIIDNSRLAVFRLSAKRTVRTLVAFWAYDERFLLTRNDATGATAVPVVSAFSSFQKYLASFGLSVLDIYTFTVSIPPMCKRTQSFHVIP